MSPEMIAILMFSSMMVMLLTGQRVFAAIGVVASVRIVDLPAGQCRCADAQDEGDERGDWRGYGCDGGCGAACCRGLVPEGHAQAPEHQAA